MRYVKRNAIAGHRFESWEGLQAHLAWWQREIVDRRCHGTTGEVPLVRFEREAGRLRPCADRPPFGQLRDLLRTVHADCAVVVDTNAYSAPWRLIGERVRGWSAAVGCAFTTVVGGPRPAAVGAV